MGDLLLRHPTSFVGNLEGGVDARLQTQSKRASIQFFVTQVHRTCADGDGSRFARQVAGRLANQVHQHLLNLTQISENLRQVGLTGQGQCRSFSEPHLNQCGELLNALREVEPFGLDPREPGVGEQLMGQFSGVERGCLEVLNGLSCGGISGKQHLRDPRISQNHREEIVVLVGNATGQIRQALQALEVHHLCLEAFSALGLLCECRALNGELRLQFSLLLLESLLVVFEFADIG